MTTNNDPDKGYKQTHVIVPRGPIRKPGAGRFFRGSARSGEEAVVAVVEWLTGCG